MPRFAKPDKGLTRAAAFADHRSFICQRGGEYLYGADKRNRRAQVFRRDEGRCQKCGSLASWNNGEMHHKVGGLVGRTDSLENLEWICGPCHRLEHVAVRSA